MPTVLLGLFLVLLVAWWAGWGVPGGDVLRQWGARWGLASPGEARLAPDTARELAAIPVRGRAHAGTYHREAFGQPWADVDRNGCDTRNDVLARDLRQTTLKPGGCAVAAGVLQDPYTGEEIDFRAGRGSRAVQIDHVVALADAWATGADAWDPAKRQQLANDPENLLAVDGPANQEKSASDAAEWLPPNRDFRCAYVARQVRIKAKYGLSMTAAEHDAVLRTLVACPGFELGR